MIDWRMYWLIDLGLTATRSIFTQRILKRLHYDWLTDVFIDWWTDLVLDWLIDWSRFDGYPWYIYWGDTENDEWELRIFSDNFPTLKPYLQVNHYPARLTSISSVGTSYNLKDVFILVIPPLNKSPFNPELGIITMRDIE